MGPRSDNRGYVLERSLPCKPKKWLQWVHGRITVVMSQCGDMFTPLPVASMGPRSDNRGYGAGTARSPHRSRHLQWLHGRITVVIAGFLPVPFETIHAPM